MTTIGRSRSGEFVPLWLCVIAVVLVGLGIFFRFYNLDRKVFWEDEVLGAVHSFGYTEAEIVAASPHLTDASDVQRYLEPSGTLGVMKTIQSLAAEDPQHPPAYYVVTHLWTQRFGGSVEALRTPAAIFGVIALLCVFWLAVELFGSLASAAIAVALVAVSPFFVLYAQEAREYSMWTAAIALEAIVFLRAIRSNALAMWIAYAAITAAALYIYPLTGLVALGFTAYLFIKERGRLTRTMRACFLAGLAALVLFVPWLMAMRTSPGVGRGMSAIVSSRLSPIHIARIFARDIRVVFFDIGQSHFGPFGVSTINVAITLLVIAMCAYAFVALVRSTPFAVWGFVVIGLCLSMMPLLVRDLLVRGEFVYQARYFLPFFLGTQLAVAALFGSNLFSRAAPAISKVAWATMFSILLAGEVLSCLVMSQAKTWWSKDYERAPEVAALINSARRPVVVSDYFTPSILELSLYLDPGVAMRLNLRCAQCVSSPARVALPSAGLMPVFAVVGPRAPGSVKDLWVDPVPYPPYNRPLNVFAFVSSAW